MPDTTQDLAHPIADTADLCARGLDGLGRGFIKSFHTCEKEFLKLGKDLDGFNTKALAVSREAADLAEMTSGETLTKVMESLAADLVKLGDVCGKTGTGGDVAGLDAVAAMGSSLMENMRDFTRLVKHLTMLGIATRIESARLGSQGLGFSTLADDVEKLAGKISDSSEKIVRRAHELSAQCQEARRSVAEMEGASAACSMSALDILRDDLTALEDLKNSSRQTAAAISGEASHTVRSVSDAVLSMQFHDIIRQQLEHVAEATDEVRSMAREGPGNEGGYNAQSWEELAGWMQSVLELQRSQLGNARSRFAEAMQTLEDGLTGIARGVETMAGQAAGLASQDQGQGQGQGGVLAQFEGEVRRVSNSLREYSVLEGRIAAVMRDVGKSISDMSELVYEIEEVGSEIELIALNASVKAAHTGEEGKALGVLASAIQKLSVDARGQTDRIMALLGSVDAAALVAASQAEAATEADSFEHAVDELDSQVAVLKDLDVQSSAMAGRIANKAKALSGGVNESVASLDFQHVLLTEIAEAEVRLQELIEALQAVLPPGASFTHPPKLQELLQRYTMEAERLVHESVLGLASHSGSSGDGELGGNIELF